MELQPRKIRLDHQEITVRNLNPLLPACRKNQRVNGLLSTFLSKPDAQTLRKLLPVDAESPEAGRAPLLLVQANVFDCGGLAIGVCMSHKLADAASLSTFIMAWSATALGFSQALLPDFSASFQFPPTDHASSFQQSSVDVKRVNCVTKSGCCIKIISSLQFPKLSVLSQSVDIRKRVVPPLSDDSIGNLCGYFAAHTDETELELQGLVAKLRKGIKELSNSYAKRLQKDQALQVVCKSFKEADELIKRDDIINFYVGTDLSNYKLLYGVSFGWGKPIWLSKVPAASNNNVASLVSTREDGGIEAWVTLSEEDMAAFEQDQELLAFAFMNPSVLEVEPITRKSAL
ncbi:BAHD acyltransferase [Prunus yedoensis var. nudiflora]|uniref:BAHD acyltransferase n=1 Tax=Prunus yedoensis var. nudiflora TaxID=2094558 RepID=A0A314V275_PRUYE|nr:BAHD acyltransferase [Prunus yedoensis var. nudiflora]